ncbi:hypothetical protein M405DRAFT_828445 [Rhizopogon salebrosus TDB-379]|nr:hypothetical protein M405DRAFT_828445 [Rhizopogon salebrosus TDB-379]
MRIAIPAELNEEDYASMTQLEVEEVLEIEVSEMSRGRGRGRARGTFRGAGRGGRRGGQWRGRGRGKGGGDGDGASANGGGSGRKGKKRKFAESADASPSLARGETQGP